MFIFIVSILWLRPRKEMEFHLCVSFLICVKSRSKLTSASVEIYFGKYIPKYYSEFWSQLMWHFFLCFGGVELKFKICIFVQEMR